MASLATLAELPPTNKISLAEPGKRAPINKTRNFPGTPLTHPMKLRLPRSAGCSPIVKKRNFMGTPVDFHMCC